MEWPSGAHPRNQGKREFPEEGNGYQQCEVRETRSGMIGTLEPIVTSTRAILEGSFEVENGSNESKCNCTGKVELHFCKFVFEN